MKFLNKSPYFASNRMKNRSVSSYIRSIHAIRNHIYRIRWSKNKNKYYRVYCI